MVLLAVDTSTQWIGLALYDGAQVRAELIWQTHNHHTVELAPALQDLFRRCGITYKDLTGLAVALGPGSFTSLRIGLAVVKGMTLALHLPVIGIPTLDVLAAAQHVQDLPLACLIQAGRSRLAVAFYQAVKGKWALQEEAQAMNIEELAAALRTPTLVTGELTLEQRHILARKRKNVILASPAQSLRRPAYLAELAWRRWQAGQVDNVLTLAPIYLRTDGSLPS